MAKFAKSITFNAKNETEFTRVLKSRVAHYFSEKRNGNKKATPFMWFKVLFFFSYFILNWYLLSFHVHGLITTALLLMSLALSFIFIAFNTAHDAVHGSLSKKSWVNDIIFWISFNMLGPNSYLWKIRHNNAHHFFVNIPGCDVDIEASKIIRFAPHVKWLPIHRFQHIYAFFGYMIFTLQWIFIKDFKLYSMKEFGNVTNLNHPWYRLVELISTKILYVALMILIPSYLLPYSLLEVVGGFIFMHMFMSLIVTLSFVGSHIGEEVEFIDYDKDGNIEHNFFVHQLKTSIDFHGTNHFVSFFYGGFNSHVAHHMFPNVCSIHLVDITKIIKNTAKEFNLPYYELSLPKLYLSHFNHLKNMGKNPNPVKERRATSSPFDQLYLDGRGHI